MQYYIAEPSTLFTAPLYRGQRSFVEVTDSTLPRHADMLLNDGNDVALVVLTPRQAADLAEWLSGFARAHGHTTGVS